MDSHDRDAVPGDQHVAEALTKHIDALQADPRPWRVHGRRPLTEAEETHAAELAVEFAHLIDD